MKSYYYIMHENKKLAAIEVQDNQEVTNIKITKDENKIQYLPYLKFGVNVETALNMWLEQRGVPVTRQGIKVDLMNMSSRSVFEYMMENLALSLTDHYWIKPYESDFSWKNVNLYENEFKSAYSLNLRDDMKDIADRTNFVPSASLKGDLKKKWIIDQNGVRRLVKGNYNNTCRQSLSEVLATEIHKRQQRFEYSPYNLIKISSDGDTIIGCETPNFTTVKTEFIPAIDIIDSIKKRNDTNYYEAYIEYCSSHGLHDGYIRSFMEYQIVTDFIISNTDRHLNNFGVIRNSKTLEFIKPAPIFDSGNSMFYKGAIKEGRGLLDIEVTSFKKKEIQLLSYVTNPRIVDISLLPSEKEVFELFMKDPAESEENNRKIARAYAQKVEFLREFQGGVKIYSYQYLKERR